MKEFCLNNANNIQLRPFYILYRISYEYCSFIFLFQGQEMQSEFLSKWGSFFMHGKVYMKGDVMIRIWKKRIRVVAPAAISVIESYVSASTITIIIIIIILITERTCTDFLINSAEKCNVVFTNGSILNNNKLLPRWSSLDRDNVCIKY